MANVFWVPDRRPLGGHPQRRPSSRTLASVIDDALIAIEPTTPPQRHPRQALRPRPARTRQAGRADRLSSPRSASAASDKAKDDVLGEVYEYFLGQFAIRRGQEGRPVLHARLGGEGAGGSARAPQGQGLRPLLRLRRHVRAVRKVRGKPRRPLRRPLHLRAGSQPHHLAAGGHEPRHPGHGLQPRQGTRRHLHTATSTRTCGPTTCWPIRPSTSPTGEPTNWRTTPAGCTACRRRQRQLRLASAHPLAPEGRAGRRAWCSPTAPCPPTRTTKAPSARRW
jgi:hypothetical protein